MNDTDPINEQLRPLRELPNSSRVMALDKLWLWQKLGVVLGVLIAVLVASLTLTPIPDRATSINGLDKLYHFLGFAALIFPLILTDSRRWRWAVPLTILFGGAIELIQPSVGRTAEWLDFGADISGVLAGAALAEILHDRILAAFYKVPDAPMFDHEAEEQRRIDEMRAELMNDLRVVLREELATSPRGNTGQHGSEQGGQKDADHLEADRPSSLRSIR
jgi:hypothetical protein